MAKQLGQNEIRAMLEAYFAGETKLSIARRFSIHHSTVIYHINHYNAAYDEQGGVYAMLRAKMKRTCVHPSYKCSVCGHYEDAIRRGEKRVIRNLVERLARANIRLAKAGLPLA